MVDHLLAEADVPVEALRIRSPTVAEVDAHPDKDFIWAVIFATRLATLDHHRSHGGIRRRPLME